MEHSKTSRSVDPVEKRRSPIRRQLNAAFCDPNGHFSISKFLAVWAQIAVLAHMNTSWDTLILKWESLTVVLVVLIAPDLLKKFISMRFNGASK